MSCRSFATILVVAAAVTAACDRHVPGTPTAPSPQPAATPTPTPVPPAPPTTALPVRTISGVVQTRGGQPLPGVTILPADGGRYESDASGAFRFPFPGSENYSGVSCTLTATAAGFEPRQIAWGIGTSDVTLAPFMLSPRLAMPPDGEREASVQVDDLGFWVGDEYDSDYCEPCHRIHVEAPYGATIRVTLSWSGATPPQLWVAGRLFSPIGGSKQTVGEVKVYSLPDTLIHVGVDGWKVRTLDSPVPYRLTTTVLPR